MTPDEAVADGGGGGGGGGGGRVDAGSGSGAREPSGDGDEAKKAALVELLVELDDNLRDDFISAEDGIKRLDGKLALLTAF